MMLEFCDRCHRQIEKGKRHHIGTRVVEATMCFVPIGPKHFIDVRKEICEDCMNDFYHWWFSGAAEDNVPRFEYTVEEVR